MGTGFDVLLTAITMTVAIIGTRTKDPKPRTKWILICLALVTGVCSIAKALIDSHHKDSMEQALISTLSPSNASYTKLSDEIGRVAETRKFNDGEKNTCHHSKDGMACFLFSLANPNGHATLVFNHDEVARMYANDLENKPNDAIILAAFDKRYQRNPWNEDYVDKVGVLGMAVCYNIFHRWGDDYNYDYKFGITVECDAAGDQNKLVSFTTKQLDDDSVPEHAADMFYAFESDLRRQLGDPSLDKKTK